MKKLLQKKSFKITFIVCAVVLTLFIGYMAYDFLFVYHIKLNGKGVDILDINTIYQDPGISIRYRGKYLKNYKEEDNIDNTKKGSYKVIYSFGKKKLTRIVEVKDIGKPSIYLNGGNLVILNYGEEYSDPGFKAKDNNDGDITNLVLVSGEVNDKKLGDYTITYKVSDSSNNISEVERLVRIVDNEPPSLSFKDNRNYAIKGKSFDYKSFTAYDNFDGDVTNKVKVTGEVDFNKVGSYPVTYTISDSNGNKTSFKRNINVQNKNTTGIPVLMYHWFYDDTIGEKAGEANTHNYISKTNLTKQLQYLKEANFYYPTWQELIDYIDNKIDLPEKSVIITDDDCANSFFKVALPLFQKYEIPVTSFCITNKNNWQKYKDEPYLDFESHTDSLHVRKCKNTKWDGAVMCTEYNDIFFDIQKSIEKVDNNYAFAYPFGHYNDYTIDALKENNVKLAFTINSGKVKRKSNKLKLPRVRISRTTTIDEYKNKLK